MADQKIKSDRMKSSPSDELPLHKIHLWQFQSVRDVLIFGGILLVIVSGYWLRSVTVPLLVALVLAYLVEPIVVRLSEHPKLNRPAVVGVFLGIFGMTGVLIAAIVVPLLVVQTLELVKAAPTNVERLAQSTLAILPDDMRSSVLDGLPSEIRQVLDSTLEAAPDDILDEDALDETDGVIEIEGSAEPAATDKEEQIESDTQNGDVTGNMDAPIEDTDAGGEDADTLDGADITDTQAAPTLAAWVRSSIAPIAQATMKTTGEAVRVISGMLGTALYFVFLLFLIPFYFYFFSVSWPEIQKFAMKTFPRGRWHREYALAAKMDLAVSGFVRGRIMISLVMGVLLAIGWAFCGVPYWLLLGLLTGILSAVPYLGGIGLPFAIILLWLSQGSGDDGSTMVWWGIILWPTIVFGAVQLLEGYVLTPLIAGKATGLGPVSILVAVLAGGVIMGIYGMILAIPVMACLKIVFTDVLLPRVEAWARGKVKDILPIGNG